MDLLKCLLFKKNLCEIRREIYSELENESGWSFEVWNLLQKNRSRNYVKFNTDAKNKFGGKYWKLYICKIADINELKND